MFSIWKTRSIRFFNGTALCLFMFFACGAYTYPFRSNSVLGGLVRTRSAAANCHLRGNIRETHAYMPFGIEVAEATGVEFIDMDDLTRHHDEAMRDKILAVRFMHITPDTHPN